MYPKVDTGLGSLARSSGPYTPDPYTNLCNPSFVKGPMIPKDPRVIRDVLGRLSMEVHDG